MMLNGFGSAPTIGHSRTMGELFGIPWIRGREPMDPSLAEMLQQSGGTESTKWSDNP